VIEMSKFVERLQQVLQPAVQSMGFISAKSEQTKPRIQLVVDVANGKSKSLLKEPDKADALLVPISAVGDGKTISGVRLSTGDAAEVEQSVKNGADFIILPASGEVLPPDKKIGKILQVEAATTDILLRTVSSLPVDAVLIKEEENGLALTWKRLMLIHRFSSLAGKPLLIEVLPAVTETELQQIWEAGVSGVIVKTDAEQPEAVALNLRNIIDKLTFPSKRKQEKSMAIVPHIESVAEEPKEDDGDGDGDDE
jgi:thiamine monophosphate synthase